MTEEEKTFTQNKLQSPNSLWACGSNGDGEIGDSTKNTPSSPKNVATNVIAISGGISLSTFIKADGTLWGCGNIFISDSATYSGPTLIPKRIF